MTDLEKVNLERILISLKHDADSLQAQADRIRTLIDYFTSGNLTYMEIMSAHIDFRLDPRMTADEAIRLATLSR